MIFTHTICPHKVSGVWTYDIAMYNSMKTFPFVNNEVIEVVSKNINNAEFGFVIHVSSEPITRAQYTLSARTRNSEGALYRLTRLSDNFIYPDQFQLNPETHVRLYVFVEENDSICTLWAHRLSKWTGLDWLLNR